MTLWTIIGPDREFVLASYAYETVVVPPLAFRFTDRASAEDMLDWCARDAEWVSMRKRGFTCVPVPYVGRQ